MVPNELWTYGGIGYPSDGLAIRASQDESKQYRYDDLGRLRHAQGKTYSYLKAGSLEAVYFQQGVCTVHIAYHFDESNNLQRRTRTTTGKSPCPSSSEIRIVDRVFEDRIVDGSRTAVGYVYVNERPLAVIIGRGTCGDGNVCQTKLYHLSTDRMNSVTRVSQPSGAVVASYSFGAWGVARRSEVSSEPGVFGGAAGLRIGYLGRTFDTDLGNIFLGARLYNPEIGRFISPDPNLAFMGFGDGANRYTYAANNPIGNSDRSGRDYEDEDYGGGDDFDDEYYDEFDDLSESEYAYQFESRADERYFTDDSYFRFNVDVEVFEIDGMSLWGATVGSVVQDGKEYSLVSKEWEVHGTPWSFSAFKVGEDQYGLGVGIGKEMGGGAFGLGGYAEGFALAGGGEYAAGLIMTEKIGPEVKGVGVELVTRPEFGGALLRAYGELEMSIKEAVGYYSVCPTCR